MMKLLLPLSATVVALSWLLPSTVAGASNRNWVQSGSEDGITECIDQNSVTKYADGYTQYQELMLCDKSDTSNNSVQVQAVRCDEDMSGATFVMRTRPLVPRHPPKDGAVHWANLDVQSVSLAGQSAKFVCKK